MANGNDGKLTLAGADLLAKQMKDFGPTVARKASDKGTRRMGTFLAKKFRKNAPKQTGHLRTALKSYYSRKSGIAYVGLKNSGGRFKGSGSKIPFYYKTLEFGREGGAPLNAWFEKTWDRYRRLVAKRIIKQTQDALYDEAAKVHEKTLRENK